MIRTIKKSISVSAAMDWAKSILLGSMTVAGVCTGFSSAWAETAIYQSYPGAPNGGSNVSAGAMWGTGLSGSSAGGDLGSAQMHQLNGVSAGYEQAARKSMLMAPGNSITIQSIGTQTIVNSSIYGNNISTTTDVDVSSTNAGHISNQATVTNTNNH
ncbi:MAG: hypothetical protein ACKOXQ_05605 [Hydrogenophaga sp.]